MSKEIKPIAEPILDSQEFLSNYLPVAPKILKFLKENNVQNPEEWLVKCFTDLLKSYTYSQSVVDFDAWVVLSSKYVVYQAQLEAKELDKAKVSYEELVGWIMEIDPEGDQLLLEKFPLVVKDDKSLLDRYLQEFKKTLKELFYEK